MKSGHQQLEGFSNLFKAQLFFTFLIRPSQGACPLLPSFLLRHSQRLSLVLIYSIQLKLKEAGGRILYRHFSLNQTVLVDLF